MLLYVAMILCMLGERAEGMSLVQRRMQPKTALKTSRFVDHPVQRILIDFSNSKILVNNLGGAGPGSGEQMILYQNVSSWDGVMVNLKIENTTEYSGNTSKNYLLGDFAQINVAPDSRVEFKLTFLDDSTNEILILPRFSISFWDFDTGKNSEGTESMEIGPVDTYFTHNNTQLIAEEFEKFKWNFTASEHGSLSDNPANLTNLDELQLSRGIEFDIVQRPHVYMAYSVTPNTHGRNFLMAGRSKLRFMGEPHVVGPCSDALTLNFGNPTTGSLGPGEPGLRISGFAQQGDDTVDLVVTSDGTYNAYNQSKNGPFGEFLNLNLADNTTSEITFSFVSPSGSPVELRKFFISFMDLDATKIGAESVIVESAAFHHYVISTKSDIQVTEAEGRTTFRSKHFGRETNNPIDIDELSMDGRKNAFALYFLRPTSEFSVKLKTQNIFTGRNFEITGNTQISCPIEEPSK